MRGAEATWLVCAVLLLARPGASLELAPGDILVAVPASGTVLHVDPDTGAQATLASGGDLVNPTDAAMAPDGQVYVVDIEAFGGGGGVIRVDPSDGSQTEWASGAPFVEPERIAVLPNGDVVVVDAGANLVVRIDADTQVATPIASTGGASELGMPLSVTIEPVGSGGTGGDILIGDGDVPDIGHFGVVRIDASTLAQTVVTSNTFLPVGTTTILDIVVHPDDGATLARTFEVPATMANVVSFDPNTGQPLLVPPIATGTSFGGIEVEADGSYLVTAPLTGVSRIDANGMLDPVSTIFTPFGLHVVRAVCSDNLDNDGDGLTDFPGDPGCSSATDASEQSVPAPALPRAGVLLLAFALAATPLLLRRCAPARRPPAAGGA